MQTAENISEYLSLRHQGLLQSIQSLQAHITSLLEDIREIADCQEQVTADVRMAMEAVSYTHLQCTAIYPLGCPENRSEIQSLKGLSLTLSNLVGG